MAAVNMKSVMVAYSSGGWVWNRWDCIGLMFELLNANYQHRFMRSNYVPTNLSIEKTIEWLYKTHADPLEPYIKLLRDDAELIYPKSSDAQIAVVLGGQPLRVSEFESYPIDKAPGLLFKPPEMDYHVFAKDGVKPVNFYPKDVKRLYRYKLEGMK